MSSSDSTGSWSKEGGGTKPSGRSGGLKVVSISGSSSLLSQNVVSISRGMFLALIRVPCLLSFERWSTGEVCGGFTGHEGWRRGEV